LIGLMLGEGQMKAAAQTPFALSQVEGRERWRR
jgi:hypothetical protein